MAHIHKPSEKLKKYLGGNLRINRIAAPSQQGDKMGCDNYSPFQNIPCLLSQNCNHNQVVQLYEKAWALISKHSSTRLGVFSLKQQRSISLPVPLRFFQRTITFHISELPSSLTKKASHMCPIEFSKGVTQCGEVKPSLQKRINSLE